MKKNNRGFKSKLIFVSTVTLFLIGLCVIETLLLSRYVFAMSYVAGEILEVSGDEQFQNNVLNSNVPVVVKFHAKWCSYCKTMDPIDKNMAIEFPGDRVRFVKIDIDDPKNANLVASAKSRKDIPMQGVPMYDFYSSKHSGSKITRSAAGTINEQDYRAIITNMLEHRTWQYDPGM